MITHDITRLIVLLCIRRKFRHLDKNKYAGNGHEWIVFVPGVLILSGHPAQAAHSRGPLHGVKKMHVMKEKIKETAG